MAQAALRARGIWKSFGHRHALADVSFEVPAGACWALLGPNGAGKTTLLRLLATLARPTSGALEVAGFVLPRHESAVRARVGVVLDHHLLPRDLTLEEGLRGHADLHGVRRPEARIQDLAARFRLLPRLGDPVRTLSRGMAQKAGLARALLHEPSVLLLDEPFNGLDAAGCGVLEQLLVGLAQAGGTVLVATHDLARAAAVASRALVLEGGRLVAVEEPTAGAFSGGRPPHRQEAPA